MGFDWDEYLTLAEELAKRADDASKRSAISRAYYAVFHRANPRALRNCGRRPKECPSAHQWCWEKYQQTNDDDCRSLGVVGDRMKQRRVSADYRDNIDRIDEVVSGVLEDARSFLVDFDALDPRFPSL